MFRFFREVLYPFRYLILGQVVLGILLAIDISLRPYLLKVIIDSLPSSDPESVASAVALPVSIYLGMSLMMVVLFRGYDVIWLKLNPPLKRHVGDVLVGRMMHHSVLLFKDQFSGSLAAKIKDCMSGVPDMVKLCVNNFFANFLAICVAAVTVFTISYKFSLLLLVWVVIFVAGCAFFSRRAMRLCKQSAHVRSKVVGYIVDIFSNILAVNLFAARKAESKQLHKHLDDYVEADQSRDWWFFLMFSFQGLSFVLYQVACFTLLIHDFGLGLVTAGDFALLTTINISIINSLWSLSSDILTFSNLYGNIQQGLDIALAPVEISDKPDAKPLVCHKGQIIFDRVQFNYKGTEPLFHSTSLCIKAGQKVGLVGTSGGGKSTLINLILRLYDVTGGRILIDGQDIREVTLDSLRAAIGMIPQDPSLFHRSVMENIRYGRLDATDAEVMEAAKKAHAHSFIQKMPQGYQMEVGERGMKLSGGQRQRIVMARAFLKNAPILILDEATSQLDSVTEELIQQSLLQLMEGKTTIVVAHRLSTLLKMDRILVFDQGQIVEDGTHYSLLAKGGRYKALWDAQVGGFVTESA